METLDREEEPQDPATRAFSALQAEVAGVLRAMTRIESAVVEKTVPDYSRDIARILASLQDVGQRLQSLEAQPMLRDTPELIDRRHAAAVRGAVANRERELKVVSDDLNWAAQTLHQATDKVRTRDEQRQWLMWTGAVTLVVGLILGPPLAHRLVQYAPDSWMWADSMASGLMGAPDGWTAGVKLLQRANAQEWNRLVENFQVGDRYGETLRACQEEARTKKTAVTCRVKVEAD